MTELLIQRDKLPSSPYEPSSTNGSLPRDFGGDIEAAGSSAITRAIEVDGTTHTKTKRASD